MTKLKPTIDFGYPTEAYGRIPAFQDIEEEAEFWDTHDLTEFYGIEFVPVDVKVSSELISRLTVDLSPEEHAALEKRSQIEEVDASTLVRTWIIERLQQEDNLDRDLQKTG